MHARLLMTAAGAVALWAASMGGATAAPGASGLAAASNEASNIQQAWYGYGYGYRPYYRSYGYGGYYRRPYYGYGYGSYYRRPYYGYGYRY